MFPTKTTIFTVTDNIDYFGHIGSFTDWDVQHHFVNKSKQCYNENMVAAIYDFTEEWISGDYYHRGFDHTKSSKKYIRNKIKRLCMGSQDVPIDELTRING